MAKIVSLETYILRVPLITPFKTALRTVNKMETLVVRICTEDVEGFGEAPPTAVITGDTLPSMSGAINSFIAPRIIGLDPCDIPAVHAQIESALVHNTSAKAAVEIALYDIAAKLAGKSLHSYLGAPGDTLETDITISVNSPEEMAHDAAIAIGRGFTKLKTKVGIDAALDSERLKAIRAAVPAATCIRVDANQGWTAEEAVRLIRGFEDAGLAIELVEQPVKGWDLEGLKHVTDNVATPILADESVFGYRDAERIIHGKYADCINIKLMKTSGIFDALRIADLARENGMRCMMGCMLEGGIAVGAAAAVALSRDNITYIDLDGPSLCSEAPIRGGADFSGRLIHACNKPGLGIAAIEGLEKIRGSISGTTSLVKAIQ